MGLYTSSRSSVLRCSALGSLLRCSERRGLAGFRVPAMTVVVIANNDAIPDPGDPDAYAFPDPVEGQIVRRQYSSAEAYVEYAYTLDKNVGGKFAWGGITVGEPTPPTYRQTAFGVYSYNPRAVWFRGDNMVFPERWKVRVYGPCSGTLIQFSQVWNHYDPKGYNDEEMTDPTWWEALGFAPVSIAEHDLSGSEFLEFTPTQVPTNSPLVSGSYWLHTTVAIFFPGTTAGDFPDVPETPPATPDDPFVPISIDREPINEDTRPL